MYVHVYTNMYVSVCVCPCENCEHLQEISGKQVRFIFDESDFWGNGYQKKVTETKCPSTLTWKLSAQEIKKP